MKLTFICGCESPEIISRENVKTMDSVRYDDEGFLVCAGHGLRRHGWRSLPVIDNNRGRTSNWSLGRYTPLEVEALVVFDEQPYRRPPQIHDETEDRRDNRDPEAIGNEVLLVKKARRGERNGLKTESRIASMVDWDCGNRYSHGPHAEHSSRGMLMCRGRSFDQT